jgi:hypothetical protein
MVSLNMGLQVARSRAFHLGIDSEWIRNGFLVSYRHGAQSLVIVLGDIESAIELGNSHLDFAGFLEIYSEWIRNEFGIDSYLDDPCRHPSWSTAKVLVGQVLRLKKINLEYIQHIFSIDSYISSK